MLVEDHGVLREGLEMLLAIEGFEIVASTSDPGDAVSLAQETRPDIALIDLFLGKGSGIEVARRMLWNQPDLGVIVYTGHDDVELVIQSLDLGARGYALKDRPPQELVAAIRSVAAGGTYIDPRLQSSLLGAGSTDMERLALSLLSPVTVIQGLSQMLARESDLLTSDQRDNVRRIAAASSELRTKLQDALPGRTGGASPPPGTSPAAEGSAPADGASEGASQTSQG